MLYEAPGRAFMNLRPRTSIDGPEQRGLIRMRRRDLRWMKLRPEAATEQCQMIFSDVFLANLRALECLTLNYDLHVHGFTCWL